MSLIPHPKPNKDESAYHYLVRIVTRLDVIIKIENDMRFHFRKMCDWRTSLGNIQHPHSTIDINEEWNKAMPDILYKGKATKNISRNNWNKGWRQLTREYSIKHQEDATQQLFDDVMDYALERSEQSHAKMVWKSALLQYIINEDKSTMVIDEDFHDIKSIDDINKSSTALMAMVAQGLMPVGFANEFNNLLVRKANFIHSGEFASQLDELKQLATNYSELDAIS